MSIEVVRSCLSLLVLIAIAGCSPEAPIVKEWAYDVVPGASNVVCVTLRPNSRPSSDAYLFRRGTGEWDVMSLTNSIQAHLMSMSERVSLFCGTRGDILAVIDSRANTILDRHLLRVFLMGDICAVKVSTPAIHVFRKSSESLESVSPAWTKGGIGLGTDGHNRLILFRELGFSNQVFDAGPHLGIRSYWHFDEYGPLKGLVNSGEGICIYDIDRDSNLFVKKKDGLYSDDVTCVAVYGNSVWIGYFKGRIDKYDIASGAVERVKTQGTRGPITCLECDGKNLFVGSFSGGLSVCSLDDHAWRNIEIGSGHGDRRVNVMVNDSPYLWIGTDASFSRLDRRSMTISNYFLFEQRLSTSSQIGAKHNCEQRTR